VATINLVRESTYTARWVIISSESHVFTSFLKAEYIKLFLGYNYFCKNVKQVNKNKKIFIVTPSLHKSQGPSAASFGHQSQTPTNEDGCTAIRNRFQQELLFGSDCSNRPVGLFSQNKPAISIFLLEQISISHQPPAKRTS
jgi:hypothetical protein